MRHQRSGEPPAEGDADARRRVVPPTARALALLVCVGAGAGAGVLLFRSPGMVEAVYVPVVTARILPLLSRVTGVVPVPVAELLAAGYVLRRGWTVFRGLRSVRTGRRSRRMAAARAGVVAVRDAGVLVVLFYGLWGFNYARAPVAGRIGLPEIGDGADPALLLRLAGQSVDEANRAYRRLHGTDDAGTPTTMPADWRVLDVPLTRGWDAATRDLDLAPHSVLRHGAPKVALSSPLLARLGLVGVFVPFTGEALLNALAPAVVLASTLAHEQAHQRGVTSEGEASFLAHVVAAGSGSDLLRYSAAVRAQLRFLGMARRAAPDGAREVAARRLPGVTRDLEDLRAYRERYRGTASRAASRVNDAYLRANQVPGGIRSYGTVTELLIRYAILRGGLFPEAGEEDPADEDRDDRPGVSRAPPGAASPIDGLLDGGLAFGASRRPGDVERP